MLIVPKLLVDLAAPALSYSLSYAGVILLFIFCEFCCIFALHFCQYFETTKFYKAFYAFFVDCHLKSVSMF